MLEESALPLDDGLGDAQDRIEALLDVADQPLGFLQLRRKLLVRRFAVARQDAAAGDALASRTPGGFESPELSTLLNQLQWITLAGKPQDRSMRIVAEGECANEQTSRQLSDLLSGLLLMAQAGLNGPQTRRGRI